MITSATSSRLGVLGWVRKDPESEEINAWYKYIA